MRVTVVGAGKMGLPLACQFASCGAEVVAVDLNAGLVAAVNAGRCPIDEPGLADLLADVVGRGRLRATTDTGEAVRSSDAVVVIVPALLTDDRDIDVGTLQAASAQIAEHLQPGTLVSYETTLPVGGTRRFLLPLLEESGLKAGEQFDLVFSPERVKSQRVLLHLATNAKIVGGLTPEGAARGAEFYTRYLGTPVLNVETLEAAEAVKLAGMIYRDVNIGVANELARYCEDAGVDLSTLIDAINTDGEAALLAPGIGVGGHCTPIYPYFLIRDAERRGIEVPIASQARETNDGQAGHVLDRFERLCWPLRDRSVLILALAFRPEVKEHTCSTAFLLGDELARRGAGRVRLHDPLYSVEEIERHGFEPGTLEDDPCPEVLVLNTAHTAYRCLDFQALADRGLRAVIDGRNAWAPEEVRGAGLYYLGVGRPTQAAGARLTVAA